MKKKYFTPETVTVNLNVESYILNDSTRIPVNPDPEHIPCFRVVNRFGEVSKAFAFGGENKQIELLEAEGIEFIDGRVDMKKYQWNKVTIDMEL